MSQVRMLYTDEVKLTFPEVSHYIDTGQISPFKMFTGRDIPDVRKFFLVYGRLPHFTLHRLSDPVLRGMWKVHSHQYEVLTALKNDIRLGNLSRMFLASVNTWEIHCVDAYVHAAKDVGFDQDAKQFFEQMEKAGMI